MKYKSFKITETPSPKFPNKVTIQGRRITKSFLNKEKAILWIDTFNAERLIKSGKKRVKGELYSIGLVDLIEIDA